MLVRYLLFFLIIFVATITIIVMHIFLALNMDVVLAKFYALLPICYESLVPTRRLHHMRYVARTLSPWGIIISRFLLDCLGFVEASSASFRCRSDRIRSDFVFKIFLVFLYCYFLLRHHLDQVEQLIFFTLTPPIAMLAQMFQDARLGIKDEVFDANPVFLFKCIDLFFREFAVIQQKRLLHSNCLRFHSLAIFI